MIALPVFANEAACACVDFFFVGGKYEHNDHWLQYNITEFFHLSGKWIAQGCWYVVYFIFKMKYNQISLLGNKSIFYGWIRFY